MNMHMPMETPPAFPYNNAHSNGGMVPSLANQSLSQQTTPMAPFFSNNLLLQSILAAQTSSSVAVSLPNTVTSSAMATFGGNANKFPQANPNAVFDLLCNGNGLMSGLLPQMQPLANPTLPLNGRGQINPDLLAFYQQQLNSANNLNLNSLLLQSAAASQPSLGIPMPLNSSLHLSDTFPPVPPPPPPPSTRPKQPQAKQQKDGKKDDRQQNDHNERCASGSPMDIEMELDEPSTSAKSTKEKQLSAEQRNEMMSKAASAMKVALKPFFEKRLISKDEYKQIMKKGVSKLVKKIRGGKGLETEKVNGFVRDYVQVFTKRRKPSASNS
jgi:hypothetical protein